MQNNHQQTRRAFVQQAIGAGAGILGGSTVPMLGSFGGGRVALAHDSATDSKKTIHVEDVKTIFSDGKHNAFTSMTAWKGKYFIAFRSATTHATPCDEGWKDSSLAPGQVMLAESTDLQSWTTSVVLDTQHDDRDPKILATKDRLYIYCPSIIGPGEKTMAQETYMVFTDDGRHWTSPVSAYRYNYGFWKPKTHQGVHYVAADIDVTPPGGRQMMQVELLRSEDGQLWQPVSTITRGGKRTETALVFLDDDSLLAICRQNVLTVARPPYTEWKQVGAGEGQRYKTMPIGIPGPAAERIGDSVVVCCRGRKQEFPDDGPGQYRTSLFTLNRQQMSLQWHCNLPTEWGGDLSYASILPQDENRFLVSYYDGQLYEKGVPKRSDIKLAQVRID
jgi:hypothetical protein